MLSSSEVSSTSIALTECGETLLLSPTLDSRLHEFLPNDRPKRTKTITTSPTTPPTTPTTFMADFFGSFSDSRAVSIGSLIGLGGADIAVGLDDALTGYAVSVTGLGVG